MAEIQPINLNPGQFHVPQVDFSWLANLPNTFQQGKANALKIDEAQRRQGALAELAKLNPNDPNFAQQVAAAALRMGDVGSAVSAINNAAELKLKREEAARETEIGKRLSQPAVAPTVAPAAPAATPQQAPAATGAPLVGPTPPLFTRTPNVSTSALPSVDISPVAQTQPTPPIMAQNATQNLMRGYMAAPDRSNVRLAGVSSELLQHANEVGNSLYGQLNRPLHITSARDSTHTTGSQHYVGNALDLRTRDLSAQQRGAIVAGFRAKGLVAVDEGDHIHVAMPRGAAPVPGAPGAPGTVMASLQGRGPTGYGGTTAPVQTAALDPANFNIGNPAVASDISPIPMARTAAVGNQAAGGPASVTNPGGAQPSLLPSPTPLQGALPQMAIPQMSLAALGQPGGVGTIGAPEVPQATPGVQMAQVRLPAGPEGSPEQAAQAAQARRAAQGAPVAPYSPAWPVPQPAATPTLPVPPPVQRPAVAPQAAPSVPPVARGASSGAPLAHVSDADLIAASSSKRWGEMARAEIARRSTVAGDQNKMSPEWGNFVRARNEGFRGDFIAFEQAKKSDNSDIVKYNWMKANGYTGTPEQYMRDYGGGQRITVDQRQQEAEEKGKQERFNERVKHAMDAGNSGFELLRSVGTLRELGVKTGAKAAITGWLAERGVKLEGASEIEAYSALIDRMTPSQRIPGAGATSDFDAKLMKSGLPNIIRSELGNEIITNTYEKLGQNYAARGELANQYDAGEINKATFLKEINKLGREAYQIGVDAVRDAKAAEAKRNEPGGGSSRLSDPPPGTDPGAWAEILKAYPGLAGGKK